MTHEDALAALQEAAQKDSAAEEQAPAEAPPATEPVVTPEGKEPAPEVQADAQGEESGVEEHTEMAEEFNPDNLPPELIPAWKQLQAAWTPKLQEAAQIRKQFEELGGIETAQQALELQQRLSDPQNWPQLYEELYEAMQQQGFEFEDGTDVPTPPVAPFDVADDPELAPLATALQGLQRQSQEQAAMLEHFRQEQAFQRQAAEAELRHQQHIANMQRQVNDIRQANKHYDDEDIRAIVELGSFYNDDLKAAQQRYEAHIARRLDRYFAAKAGATPPSVQPQPGAGVLSEQERAPLTLREAEEEAVEYLRNLQAAGDLDL